MATVTVDRTTQTFTSEAQPEPDVSVLHTTEGMGWPDYAGGSMAPHATIRATPGKGIIVREHIPFTQHAKALRNLPGGVQTNRRGVIQFELIGTCDPKHKGDPAWYYWPDADDVVLEALADYLRPIHARFGIPAVAPAFLPYPSSYGNRQGQRFTADQWNAFQGICGHQHVPENDHGDPGAFPISKLIAFLQGDDMPLNDDDKKWLESRLVAHSLHAQKWHEQRTLVALATLVARDPATVTAADIAAAIPDGFAQEVVDALASRLTKESPNA